VDDGDVGCHVGSGGEGADTTFGINADALSDDFQKSAELLWLHEGVNVGVAFLKRFGLGANHAAHQRQNFFRVLLFEGFEAGKHSNNPVLGAFADDTAIENDNVGIARAFGGAKAHLTECAFHALRVGLVHLASYGPDVVTFHS